MKGNYRFMLKCLIYLKLGLVVGIGLLLFATKAAALTIYECEDEHGNRSFEQSCPPGTTKVGERGFSTGQHSGGPDMDEAAASAPIVMYAAPDCDACDVVRNHLQQRDIPFTEKDVSNDIDMQEELLDKTGQLSVPVTLIGEKTISGYNRSALETELQAAGYTDGASAQAAP